MPLLGRPGAAGCNSRVGSPLLSGDLTPGITRRPASLSEDEVRRVGGRVHAPVRLRPPLAPAPSHAPRAEAFNLRHASHNRLLPRPSQTSRLVTPPANAVSPPASEAYSNSRNSKPQQQSNARHHPPPRQIDVYDRQRVGGRVHAVVRRGLLLLCPSEFCHTVIKLYLRSLDIGNYKIIT